MGLIVPTKEDGALTPPQAVMRAINLMIAAGFDGKWEYREDTEVYPGANFVNKTVTFERRDGMVKETYMADIFARYPMITISEAASIGLLHPHPTSVGI